MLVKIDCVAENDEEGSGLLGVEIYAEHSWHFATRRFLMKLTNKVTNKNFKHYISSIFSILINFGILEKLSLNWIWRTVSFSHQREHFPLFAPPKMSKKKTIFFSNLRYYFRSQPWRYKYTSSPNDTRTFTGDLEPLLIMWEMEIWDFDARPGWIFNLSFLNSQ